MKDPKNLSPAQLRKAETFADTFDKIRDILEEADMVGIVIAYLPEMGAALQSFEATNVLFRPTDCSCCFHPIPFDVLDERFSRKNVAHNMAMMEGLATMLETHAERIRTFLEKFDKAEDAVKARHN